METVVGVAVLLALIAVGALLIHRVNAQTGNKIAPERHSVAPARHHHRHHRHHPRPRRRGHRMAPPRV
ncbi:hypothetical protein ACWC5C_30720 [Streptomyces sp. NPDC001700]